MHNITVTVEIPDKYCYGHGPYFAACPFCRWPEMVCGLFQEKLKEVLHRKSKIIPGTQDFYTMEKYKYPRLDRCKNLSDLQKRRAKKKGGEV